MKTLRLPALLLVATLALSACATKSGTQKPEKKKPAVSATQPAPEKPRSSLFAKILVWTNPLNLIPKKAKPPVAQQPRMIGVVKMVNRDDKYVLIDAVTQNAEPGDLLICITNQKETANLRMSGLKNPPFLIADIASGTPVVGDRVFKP